MENAFSLASPLKKANQSIHGIEFTGESTKLSMLKAFSMQTVL